jgi:gamma-glutamylcyclotransferase (GGCT)/AIG2-like uncharacterized protein YtfP
MEEEFLFVYGTLRKCFGHPMHHRMIRYADYIASAKVRGKLFDLGNYPGLVDSGEDDCTVTGDIYLVSNGQKLFDLLDPYEGVTTAGSTSSEYKREKRAVIRLDSDERVICWVYLYNRNPEPYRRIISGDYCAYIHGTLK